MLHSMFFFKNAFSKPSEGMAQSHLCCLLEHCFTVSGWLLMVVEVKGNFFFFLGNTLIV